MEFSQTLTERQMKIPLLYVSKRNIYVTAPLVTITYNLYLWMLLDGDGDLDHESDGLLPVHVHHLGLAAAGNAEPRRPGLDQRNF